MDNRPLADRLPPAAAPARAPFAWLINDPRDLPFLSLTAVASAVVLPFAVALFIPGVFRWWLALIYLAVVAFGFLDRFILMLHNTSHRPLFARRYRWLNGYLPWVLGPFFGESPETYFAHHVAMHHYENNLTGDLSSTMPYQRDNFAHFLHYYFSFIGRGLADLAAYLTRKKRLKIRRKMMSGEAFFWLAAAGLACFNWRATLVVFVFPLFAVRFLMMAGNWGQHAFIDAHTPESPYRNSITCLGARYNRRCFNDGYHIGHHVKQTRHWTEMPADFEANRALYARERAIVFRRLDHFGVWLHLMLKDYRTLAKNYLPLAEPAPSEAEVVELLRARARPLPAKADAAAV